MNYHDFLDSVDDSHSMTTAKEHIREICRVAEKLQGGLIVELGSHAGISAAALALAAPRSVVVSVDLCDTVSELERVECWARLGIENIIPVEAAAADYVRAMPRPADLIFHDADHGDRVVPEYIAAAAKCKTLAIHDWEQLSFESQQAVMGLFKTWWYPEPDARGRFLWIGSNE
jgi:predicted O-methyltransferase YrrM